MLTINVASRPIYELDDVYSLAYGDPIPPRDTPPLYTIQVAWPQLYGSNRGYAYDPATHTELWQKIAWALWPNWARPTGEQLMLLYSWDNQAVLKIPNIPGSPLALCQIERQLHEVSPEGWLTG